MVTEMKDMSGDEACDALGIERVKFGPPLPFWLAMAHAQAELEKALAYTYEHWWDGWR